MMLIDSSDRLKILISLSEQLWEDLNNNDITHNEYATNIDLLRKEIRREVSSSFRDIQDIACNVGYVIVKRPNVFGKLKTYTIIKN